MGERVRVVVVGGEVEMIVNAGAVEIWITVTVAAGKAETDGVEMIGRADAVVVAVTVTVTVTPPTFCVSVSVHMAVVIRIEGEMIVAVVVAVRNMKDVFHFVRVEGCCKCYWDEGWRGYCDDWYGSERA